MCAAKRWGRNEKSGTKREATDPVSLMARIGIRMRGVLFPLMLPGLLMILIPCALVLLAVLAFAFLHHEPMPEPVAFAMPSLGGCEYCGCEFSRNTTETMPSLRSEGICVGCEH